MTSAPRGGEGVAQNLTKTDTGEGGRQSDSDIIFGTSMTDYFTGKFLFLLQCCWTFYLKMRLVRSLFM